MSNTATLKDRYNAKLAEYKDLKSQFLANSPPIGEEHRMSPSTAKDFNRKILQINNDLIDLEDSILIEFSNSGTTDELFALQTANRSVKEDAYELLLSSERLERTVSSIGVAQSFPVSSEPQASEASDKNTIKSPENTKPDTTAEEAAFREANAEIATDPRLLDDEFGDLDSAIKFQQEAPAREAAAELLREGRRSVPVGAEKQKIPSTTVKFKSIKGEAVGIDLRVKIKVPSEYYETSISSSFSYPLSDHQGVIFPYTPSIKLVNSANYSYQQPIHSNFPLYFYQSSSVSKIMITGKFTVQNDNDALFYLTTVHILRSLTKMRSGGTKNDLYSGSPPPICKLDGYGKYMISNIPVVIGSFSIELPESVDYYSYKKEDPSEITSVPTISTISVECIPMYSRKEMQEFNVPSFLSAYGSQRLNGYV